MMKWNPEQEKAISTLDKNIVVSASAGAGKTSVLVARLMKRIKTDHVPVDRILAMTFTEAAAGEMKKRLLRELNDSLKDSGDAFLKKQLALIPSANISTIHSFCLSIIRKYYYILQLDPEMSQNIMDEAAVSLARKAAMQKTIADAYQKKNPAFQHLLDILSPRPQVDRILEEAINIVAGIAEKSLDPQQWLRQHGSYYKNYPSLQKLPEEILYYFFDSLFIRTQKYLQALAALQEYAASLNAADIEAVLDNQYNKALQLLVFLKERNYQAYYELAESCFDFSVPRSPLKNDDEYSTLRKEINDSYKEMLINLFTEADLLEDIAVLEEPLKQLLELTSVYLQYFQESKLNQQAMDFNDMERYAYQILIAENEAIAKIYRKQFIDIYVDEFQDTNLTQNEIVNLISNSNNVFRVGDVKQSIYRFRGARPTIMRELLNNPQENDEIIHLNYNYRSQESIVEFNNQLFTQLMNLEGVSDSYAETDYVKAGDPRQQENNKAVEFILLDKKSIQKENEELNSHEKYIRAQFIANKIIELWKNSPNKKWSDYVVLIRNHQLKIDLKRAFEQSNIPHFISMPSGFYQSGSVQTVLSCLKVIINPDDNIALITVLKHLYHLSNEELAEMSMEKGKNNSYHKYLQQSNSPLLYHLEKLTKRNDTLSQLLTAIYETNQFYSDHCSRQEKTNLDLLYEKAVEFEKRNTGLLAFLNYISQIEDEKTAEANSISSDADVVRVMTVHQSKGLEFPTVIFWSTSRQQIHEERSVVTGDEKLGIAMATLQLPDRIRRRNLIYTAVLHKTTKEELEEQIRLLYVALTRAKNHLLVVDNYKDVGSEKMTYANLFDKIGYSGWLHKTKNFIQPTLLNEEIISDLKPTIMTYKPHPTVELPVYQQSLLDYQIISPSETENLAPKLQLNFSENRGKQTGTDIHSIIERLPKNWTEETIKEISPDISPYWLESLLTFSKTDIYQNIQKMDIQKELAFIVRNRQQIIHGYMDMVATDSNNCIMIDFKTDRLEKPQEFIDRYNSQISLYKQALKQIYPDHNTITYIYSFYLQQFIQI